eukprot:GFUD01007483.1.p1 GENE.GFUD01007483.1~~GFUD01007483.1.p1  ORF type:complete len:204 (-),score=46.70 GFUD01007483.1:145-699(-)
MRVSCSQPQFLYPLDNITVAVGQEAQFTCVVNNLGGHKVAWLRLDTKAILAIHKYMVTNNKRMSVSHSNHTWMLIIKDVKISDSGNYVCQMNTNPGIGQVGTLEVVDVPGKRDKVEEAVKSTLVTTTETMVTEMATSEYQNTWVSSTSSTSSTASPAFTTFSSAMLMTMMGLISILPSATLAVV